MPMEAEGVALAAEVPEASAAGSGIINPTLRGRVNAGHGCPDAARGPISQGRACTDLGVGPKYQEGILLPDQ